MRLGVLAVATAAGSIIAAASTASAVFLNFIIIAVLLVVPFAHDTLDYLVLDG